MRHSRCRDLGASPDAQSRPSDRSTAVCRWSEAGDRRVHPAIRPHDQLPGGMAWSSLAGAVRLHWRSMNLICCRPGGTLNSTLCGRGSSVLLAVTGGAAPAADAAGKDDALVKVAPHGVVNTPVARWALIARGTAYSNRFLVPSGDGLPHILQGRRPHWSFRGLLNVHWLLRPVGSPQSPKRPVCLEGSDGFVSSPRRFDSYRLERPSCRVGIAPTEGGSVRRFNRAGDRPPARAARSRAGSGKRPGRRRGRLRASFALPP